MKKQNKIIIGKIISIFVTVLLVSATVLCFTVIKQTKEAGYVSLGGHSFFRVVTGSMSPEIEIGELILTKKQNINDIKIKDIVSFVSVSPKTKGLIITHRVVGIESDENGNVMLVTKGDANLPTDTEPVTENNYIGKVIWCSGERNFIKTVHSFLSNKSTFFLCIVAPCLLIFGFVFKDNVSKIKKDLELLKEEAEKKKEDIALTDGTGVAEKRDEELSDNGGDAYGSLEQFKESNPEDFEEMCRKIRKELVEELKQSDDQGQSTK